MIPDFLTLPDRRLAYQLRRGPPGRPGIVFLSGYSSDMTGSKAEFLARRCATANLGYLRFDYSGHGQSSGDFQKGTIGGWFEDTALIFDQLTEGPQIVVGSSMGGWIALMLALKYPPRMKALIGIAAAPDFTDEELCPYLTTEQKIELDRNGVIFLPGDPGLPPLPLTRLMVEESSRHFLLRAPLPVTCPVRLLQGMKDVEVPWQHAQRIADAIPQGDVRVILVKDGEHRLSRPEDLDLLWRTVEEFL